MGITTEYNVETVSARERMTVGGKAVTTGKRVVLAYVLMTRTKVGRKWSAWTKVRNAVDRAEAIAWAAQSGYIVRGAGK